MLRNAWARFRTIYTSVIPPYRTKSSAVLPNAIRARSNIPRSSLPSLCLSALFPSARLAASAVLSGHSVKRSRTRQRMPIYGRIRASVVTICRFTQILKRLFARRRHVSDSRGAWDSSCRCKSRATSDCLPFAFSGLCSLRGTNADSCTMIIRCT